MLKPKKKVTFTEIWELIKQSDVNAGIFLFKDPAEKWTKTEKWLKLTWPVHGFLVAFLIVSTLIITKFALINIIISFCVLSVIFLLYMGLTKMIVDRMGLKDLFDWCKSLYFVEKIFHNVVEELAEANIFVIERRAKLMLKWIKIVFYIIAFGMTVGFAIIGIFLPENIYPKYSAPIPLYLPFTGQKSWLTFVVTVAVQTIFLFCCAKIAVYIFGTFFCITFHIFGCLDIIKDVVVKMKQEMVKAFNKYEGNQE